MKCCNTAWHVVKGRQVANGLISRQAIERLVGPCFLLNGDGTCAHHNGNVPCAYLDRGWAQGRHPLCEEFVNNQAHWPVFNLAEERRWHETNGK